MHILKIIFLFLKTPVKVLTNMKEKIATLQEALVAIPKNFILKTERLSKGAKEAHFNLYKKYVDSFNKISSELDAVNRQNANSTHSSFRSLKVDENYNLNGIKLHELYWANISDLNKNFCNNFTLLLAALSIIGSLSKPILSDIGILSFSYLIR